MKTFYSIVDNYQKVVKLKLQNPDLKISLAIGGWTHGVEKFTQLVDNTANMNTFAGNVITYLRNINFDGLDLDWEYPAHRGSPPEDRERFTLHYLVQCIKKERVHVNCFQFCLPVKTEVNVQRRFIKVE
jgi:GH18 family chitinase